jgi:hypothetical protein
MPIQTLADHDETLEVLAHLQHDRQGRIVCHFIDASGNKVFVRLNPQAAQDFYDELGELLAGD